MEKYGYVTVREIMVYEIIMREDAIGDTVVVRVNGDGNGKGSEMIGLVDGKGSEKEVLPVGVGMIKVQRYFCVLIFLVQLLQCKKMLCL